jgi:TerC family integral membrane protein
MHGAGLLEWGVFIGLVVGLLAVDIAFGRQTVSSARRAWIWSAVWIGVALAFGAWIAVRLGSAAGLDYVTAYLLEKSLSIDNLVVFALVFSQTGVPPSLQRRVLLWGVAGALVMRALLIGFGIFLIQRFQWIIYPFGALLAYAAWRMWKGEQEPRYPWVEATCTLCSSWISRFIPITPQPDGERFVVKIDGKRHATPLLVALVAIESADLVFAVDSIPAVFAVTRDPFLVYSSNIFALLGLRSLYAVIGNLIAKFRYLRIGLAVLLLFVGAKLVLSGVIHIPAGVSLGVIAAIVALAIAASRLLPDPSSRKESPVRECTHLDEMKVLEPATRACAQCLALGDTWVHLRLCTSCGHVACCDSSKNKHATRHFHETHHPIVRSIEPGERWKWCYVDQVVIE